MEYRSGYILLYRWFVRMVVYAFPGLGSRFNLASLMLMGFRGFWGGERVSDVCFELVKDVKDVLASERLSIFLFF